MEYKTLYISAHTHLEEIDGEIYDILDRLWVGDTEIEIPDRVGVCFRKSTTLLKKS